MFGDLIHSPLSKNVIYRSIYDPSLLYPIPRKFNRLKLKINNNELPFYGYDIWNGYELSWLNQKGKPEVAFARFVIPCTSKNIIESKSFKMYLNSFNNTKFNSINDVKEIIKNDISYSVQESIDVQLTAGCDEMIHKVEKFSSLCIDDVDIECTDYSVSPHLLKVNENIVEESLYSNLLKSNCPVTGQPDWGSIEIKYKGYEISKESLLKYIVSYRNHQEFHEHCIESIFIDIMLRCRPEELTVYGAYTRRGGLDINPIRSTDKNIQIPVPMKLARQ